MEEIKRSFNKIWFGGFFGSLLFLVIGILLLVRPEQIITVIVDIIGIGIIVLGVFGLIRYFRKNTETYTFDLMYGIICIIAGILIMTNVRVVASFLPIVIGIWMIGNSIIKIQYALTLREFKESNWLATMIVSVLTLGCGILFVFNPFKGATLITQSLGIVLCIYAIVDMVNSVILKVEIKKFTNAVKNTAEKVKEAVYEDIKVEQEEVKDAEVVEEKKEEPKKKATPKKKTTTSKKSTTAKKAPAKKATTTKKSTAKKTTTTKKKKEEK